MEITVTQNKVCVGTGEIHEGEFNVNPLHFNFSSEYTIDLVKKVVFSALDGNYYEETIINNTAIIPTEVTQKTGEILIGVYAYEVEGQNLRLRYSPSPMMVKVHTGSYVDAEDGTIEIPALTVEQYEQALNEIIERWTIDSEAIINNIVTTSEAQFNVYYNGKVSDFDTYAENEEAEFTQDVGNYVTGKEEEFAGVVTTAKTEIADMTTALTFATFDVDPETGVLYMNTTSSLGNMVFSVGDDGHLYVTI